MKIKKYTNGAWTDLDKPVKKYDAYTDEATTLPLTIQTSATDAVENYQVYGASGGVGEATSGDEPQGYKIPILNMSGVTENEFDYTIPYASYLQSDGTVKSTAYNIYSIMISLAQWVGKQITISIKVNSTEATRTFIVANVGGSVRESGYIYAGQSGEMKLTLTPTTENDKFSVSYSSNPNGMVVLSDFMIVKGSTAPDHYIPHSYESNYDLFIGDSKLYEDEYLDFVEQKVYKRTDNLFNKDAKDTNNGYVANKYLKSTGEEISDASDAISEYIPIKPNTTYKTLYAEPTVRYNSDAVCFYDVNKVYISGTAYSNSNPKSFSTPSNAVYIRLSYRNKQASINMVTLYEGTDSDPTVYQPYYQPTDPPAPFPALTTYIGESNLSVDTTVRPEKASVEYEGWKGIGDVEKYQNGEWSDSNGT